MNQSKSDPRFRGCEMYFTLKFKMLHSLIALRNINFLLQIFVIDPINEN